MTLAFCMNQKLLQAAELSALSTEGLFLAPAVESRSHLVRSAARVGLVLRHLVMDEDDKVNDVHVRE